MMTTSLATHDVTTVPNHADDELTQRLVDELRHPPKVFGTASPAGLEAAHEECDWAQALDDVRHVLRVHRLSPEILSSKLDAAARFVRLHGLRLHGSPWFHVIRYQGVASVSYVVHLDLDQHDATTWNDRFQEKLASMDLLGLPFYVSFRARGPG